MEFNKKNIEAWFESEEGKLACKRFQEKIKNEDNLNNLWLEKFDKYLKTLNDGELFDLFKNYNKWEDKYCEMWYQRGVETNSNILSYLWQMFTSKGEPIDIDESFVSAAYTYRGYCLKLIQGQGSYFSLEKI